MRSYTTTGAALLAALGISVITFGITASSTGASAPPTTPVPPTCTCPPAQPPAPPTTGPSGPGAPTSVAPAPPTTAPGAPTTAPGGPTASTTPGPTAGGASGLPANASLQQLLQAIEPMLGPSTDLMAGFAVFGITPPAGVPTPDGADVNNFQMRFESLHDPEDAYYDATLVVTSTLPAADLVTLYQTQMPAAGFTQTGDSVENTDSGRQIRWLEYSLPNSTHFMAEFAVGIVDDDQDFIQIEFADAVDPALAAPFSSWSGVPLADQALAVDSASIGNFLAFGNEIHIETEYRMPMPTAVDLEAQFLAAVPGSPYTQNVEESQAGDWAVLQGGEFADLTVYFHDGLVEGTSRIIVDARFEPPA